MRDHLEYVDPATKELKARHDISQYPREINVRMISKERGVVKLFNVDTEITLSDWILFPAGLNGGMGQVRYECYHAGKWGEDEVLTFKKVDNSRRRIESTGVMLPGRG